MSERRAFIYGDQRYDYSLMRRDRKTLSISVLPDMTIEVAAPLNACDDDIDKRLRKRAGWIKRQMQFFGQFHPRTPTRKYVAGETHLYLGRRYRLKVTRALQQQVKLKHGFIEVHTHRPSRSDLIEAQVAEWYKTRARKQFARRLT